MRRKSNVDISENIRKAMDGSGIKPSELAEILGMKVESISRYRAGDYQPSYENLIAMCKIFNVSTDWMLGLTACRTPDAFDLLPEQTRADLQTILNSPKRDKLLRLCAEVIEE